MGNKNKKEEWMDRRALNRKYRGCGKFTRSVGCLFININKFLLAQDIRVFFLVSSLLALSLSLVSKKSLSFSFFFKPSYREN